MSFERPAVFADTNVLVPAALRDILIELALDDLIRLNWSPGVMAELREVLGRRPGAVMSRIDSMLAAMDAALPQASIGPLAEHDFLARLPDPDDEHVLLAALSAQCANILTFNLKDFPARVLGSEEQELQAMHPDAFLVHMLTSQAPAVLLAIKRILASLTAPPLSADTYLANLSRTGLPTSATLLRHLLIP